MPRTVMIRGRCIADWAAITGIPASTLYARRAYGWRDRRILETPIDETKAGVHRQRYLRHGGLRLTVRAWSARTGLKVGTIHARLRRGWSSAERLIP